MAEVAILKQKRATLKGQITRFKNFLAVTDDADINQLRVRLGQLEDKVLDEFNEIQLKIELLEPGELDLNNRDEFETYLFENIAIARSKLSDFDIRNEAQITQRMQRAQLQNVDLELKKFNLPIFSGEYDKWYKFKNTFLSLVDKNAKFDKVQKFYRLLECLRGDAEKVLAELEVSEHNYNVAWDMLVERFEDKPGIIEKHLKALIDLPILQGETVSDIRAFLDELNSHWRALKSLGEPVETWDRMLILLMSRKLPGQTKVLWNDARVGRFKGEPTIDNFKTFLAERCKSIEALGDIEKHKNKAGTSTGHNMYSKKEIKSSSYVAINFENKCKFCNGQHAIYHCERFKNLSIDKRWHQIKTRKLCSNCLRSNHFVRECRSDGCKKCQKKHNTLLHNDERSNWPKNTGVNVNQGQDSTSAVGSSENAALPVQLCVTNSQIATHCRSKTSQILLPTAIVYVRDNKGNYHETRCLLDSGSQSCFMTEKLRKVLQLPVSNLNLNIVGISQVHNPVKMRTETKIKSRFYNYEISEQFLILEKITSNLPNHSFDMSRLEIPPNIKLADERFNSANEVDMLLNARIFFETLVPGQTNLGVGLPVLQKTLFGWVVAGPLTIVRDVKQHETTCNLSLFRELDDIEKFWKIEECDEQKLLSREERECEEHFVETITRDGEGKFVVTLPTRENIQDLGNSLQIAEKRLISIERKFAKNPNFKEKYATFMREYFEMGHMAKIADNKLNLQNNDIEQIYYLPHHGVLNESSSTTKLRVVFDGSAKPFSGLALNDVLKIGPCIQDDLFSILCRFRWHNVVITSDIAKMYRMINVNENQQNLQRILWRENAQDEMQHFKLTTITYGTGPASFLATRCLKQIAHNVEGESPFLSEIIARDFYVDDLITGGTTEAEATFIAQEISRILSDYGFNLRKWNSNKLAVLETLAGSDRDNLGHFLSENDSSKTLGIFWNAISDELEYVVDYKPRNYSQVTKRVILASIAQIFDPLGLIGPVITKAKILMQRLWQLKISWDEVVPSEIICIWREFETQVQILHTIKIPRHVSTSGIKHFELHGFSDASERASGACIFVRAISGDGLVSVKLLCAKSRVAPLKTISLPRLELMGAVLLTRLMRKVLEALNHNVQTFYWCDSKIVLCWLAEEPHVWKTFIANRVSEIQSLSDIGTWHHVESKQNPADIISRGANPRELINLDLWWNGPQFLYETPITRLMGQDNQVNEIPERKRVKPITLVSQMENFNIFDRYSTLSKLQRVTAWCMRFLTNCRLKGVSRLSGDLSNIELRESLNILIRLAQDQEFAKERACLTKNKQIFQKSMIKSLDPFLDENKLLRVGGRLRKASVEYDRKFQIILPYKHNLTKLVIQYEHFRQFHAGPQATLNAVRQRYWPINGRRAVRSVLSKCILCFKAKPIPCTQKMGDLPFDRVNQSRPFYVSGTDFAGPFLIKDGKLRNRVIIKAYMCIFVCFATKAVHIELVSDLSAESFLNAFKRFISRRGLCKRIYSDNGSNYIGSSNQIKEMQEFIANLPQDSQISKVCSDNNIDWVFIPAKSPHQGGLWESAVKSAKFHSQRIVGNNHLTFEELSTIFSQIEAVLNSRPLTEMSHDPADLTPLTPGHFLIGSPLTTLPEADVQEVTNNRLSRYQLLQKMFQHFWSRWSHEYLCSLQRRNKWLSSSNNVLIGSLVLLREDNLAPLNWKLGRIVQTHPGTDGAVRVVSVKTSSSVVKRSVQKVCVLPIGDNLD